jgi:hypothetical protein
MFTPEISGIPGISVVLYLTALSNIQLRNYKARGFQNPENKGEDIQVGQGECN